VDELEALDGTRKAWRMSPRDESHHWESLRPSSDPSLAYQVVVADAAKADAGQLYDWAVERGLSSFSEPR
jgi:hypothetical protein